MGVNLVKGGSVTLARHGHADSRLKIGLGWEARAVDLDASALLLAADGRVSSDAHLVFFNNANSPDGAVTHLRDERAGGSGDDDEALSVDLGALPSSVDRIVFVVSIYGGEHTFADVGYSYIRISNQDSGAELARYEMDAADPRDTAVVIGELYRHGPGWKFRAGGAGSPGGLAEIVRRFGVRVAES